MDRLVPVAGRESVKLREPPKAFGTNPRSDNKDAGASGKTRRYGHNPKDKANTATVFVAMENPQASLPRWRKLQRL